MLQGIDHLVLAVTDPDAAAVDLETRLGLTPGGGGRHEALGTYNRLVWLGDTYLELIGVFDPELAAGSWVGAPTLRALERGGGLAMWAIATDAIDHDTSALRARGSELAEPATGERRRADGEVVRWRLAAAPRLAPGLPPFLIEHDTGAAEWTPADRATRADGTAGTAHLTVLELSVEDVNRTSQAFLRSVGLRFRPSLVGGGTRDANIGRQTARLRPRRQADPPRSTVHLTVRGREAVDVDLLGLRWRIEALPAD